ncbi:SPBc2 prophage-derived uncharacterized protein YorR [compost metagenome]
MLLILEGPDGAGKSRLARRLQRQTGYAIKHFVKPKTDEEKAGMYLAYDSLVSTGQSMIVDRCWYSEMVYGQVMRNQTFIDVKQMHYLETRIAESGGGMIIHCTDNPTELWERATARGEDLVTDFKTLKSIALEYELLMHRTKHNIPVVRYELSKKVL